MALTAWLMLLAAPMPVQGQIVPDEQEPQVQPLPPLSTAPPGGIANSPVGQIGQRQSRGQAVEGIKPSGRIGNRIQNRVQLRLRNRIDRNYNPQANATDPFGVADQQLRRASNPRP